MFLVIIMHSLHTRYMLSFIRSLHGGVRFSCVPYVVHPFISRYSTVTTRCCACSSSVYIRSYPLYISFSPFIIRLSSVTFCKILPNLAPYTNE